MNSWMGPKIKFCNIAKISTQEKRKYFIYYSPGGNWGDLYPEVQTPRLRVLGQASRLGLPFISGNKTQ